MVAVPISGTVLQHLGTNESSPFPTRLHHTFTEVTVEGKLCRVDSYVVDPQLFRAAQERLKQAASVQGGWGIHREGENCWDGQQDSFSQYVPSTHTPELEQKVASSRDLTCMNNYLHQDLMALLSIPLIGRFGFGFLLEGTNKAIQAIRNSSK